jgi:hypothetical protein
MAASPSAPAPAPATASTPALVQEIPTIEHINFSTLLGSPVLKFIQFDEKGQPQYVHKPIEDLIPLIEKTTKGLIGDSMRLALQSPDLQKFVIYGGQSFDQIFFPNLLDSSYDFDLHLYENHNESTRDQFGRRLAQILNQLMRRRTLMLLHDLLAKSQLIDMNLNSFMSQHANNQIFEYVKVRYPSGHLHYCITLRLLLRSDLLTYFRNGVFHPYHLHVPTRKSIYRHPLADLVLDREVNFGFKTTDQSIERYGTYLPYLAFPELYINTHAYTKIIFQPDKQQRQITKESLFTSTANFATLFRLMYRANHDYYRQRLETLVAEIRETLKSPNVDEQKKFPMHVVQETIIALFDKITDPPEVTNHPVFNYQQPPLNTNPQFESILCLYDISRNALTLTYPTDPINRLMYSGIKFEIRESFGFQGKKFTVDLDDTRINSFKFMGDMDAYFMKVFPERGKTKDTNTYHAFKTINYLSMDASNALMELNVPHGPHDPSKFSPCSHFSMNETYQTFTGTLPQVRQRTHLIHLILDERYSSTWIKMFDYSFEPQKKHFLVSRGCYYFVIRRGYQVINGVDVLVSDVVLCDNNSMKLGSLRSTYCQNMQTGGKNRIYTRDEVINGITQVMRVPPTKVRSMIDHLYGSQNQKISHQQLSRIIDHLRN